MQQSVEYLVLDDALRRCGASWNAAQAHGLLCGRLTAHGSAGVGEWLGLVLDPAVPDGALRTECAGQLETVSIETQRQLAERQSRFSPLLPDDAQPVPLRTEALANWCEGYLHGLVSGRHGEALKARLAEEPVAEIIRDLLAITRATVDDEAQSETNDAAYTELVEYVRIAAQLAYEELAELRPSEAEPRAAPPRRLH